MSKPTLAQLVQVNPCVHALLLACARNHPHDRYTDADHVAALLQAEGQAFPPSVITGSFLEMARCGLGKPFTTDLLEHGFHWAVLPLVALEFLRTGTSPVGDSALAADIAVPQRGDPVAHSLPVHRFRLRTDCTVRLDLPEDLTDAEASRIGEFLASLVCQKKKLWSDIDDDLPEDDFGNEDLDDDEDAMTEKEAQAMLDGDWIVDDLGHPEGLPEPVAGRPAAVTL